MGPPPHAGSGLDTVASRVDHLVVAVESAVLASATLTERYGFHAHPDPQHPEVITMVAGGVTVVLVGRAASAGVEEPPRWRWSGRWWTKPIPSRRVRP